MTAPSKPTPPENVIIREGSTEARPASTAAGEYVSGDVHLMLQQWDRDTGVWYTWAELAPQFRKSRWFRWLPWPYSLESDSATEGDYAEARRRYRTIAANGAAKGEQWRILQRVPVACGGRYGVVWAWKTVWKNGGWSNA